MPNKSVFVLLALMLAPFVSAQTNSPATTNLPAQAYDCTGVKVDDVNPDELTKAERLALMEKSLVVSVDRYSSCISAVQSQMAGGGEGGGQGGGQTSGEGQGGSGAGLSNADMQANPQEGAPSEETAAQEQANVPVTLPEQNSNQERFSKGSDPTKVKLIPPKDNDAIICAMLYEEIMSQQDEKTKQDLAQQYKDYKCGQ